MKKIICGILLVIICLSAVSCGGSDVQVPSDMQIASEDADVYYLFVPKGWTVKRSYDMPYAFISASDTTNVTVMTYMLSADETDSTTADNSTDVTTAETVNPLAPYIDAFWNDFVEDANTTLYEFNAADTVINEVTLDNRFAKQYTYTHNAGGVTYKHRAVATYYGDMVICVTYTSTEDKFDAHAADFDSIIREFLFKQ